MPNEISNALGTARQFTPKPDSLYQGRYKDMGYLRLTQVSLHGLLLQTICLN